MPAAPPPIEDRPAKIVVHLGGAVTPRVNDRREVDPPHPAEEKEQRDHGPHADQEEKRDEEDDGLHHDGRDHAPTKVTAVPMLAPPQVDPPHQPSRTFLVKQAVWHIHLDFGGVVLIRLAEEPALVVFQHIEMKVTALVAREIVIAEFAITNLHCVIEDSCEDAVLAGPPEGDILHHLS